MAHLRGFAVWARALAATASFVAAGVAGAQAPDGGEARPGAGVVRDVETEPPEAASEESAPEPAGARPGAGVVRDVGDETPGPSPESAAEAREARPGAETEAAPAGEPGVTEAEGRADAEGRGAEAPAAEGAVADEADRPYTVECEPDPDTGANVCFVDRGTYVGWRTFHAVCHTCHAQDAVGSSFAPALLPRIRQMDKTRFVTVVDEGYTGQTGVMPAWGDNPNVNRYYDELWSYLRARADGVLAPGRPRRLPEEE